jgi:Bacterial EndoU nuclease
VAIPDKKGDPGEAIKSQFPEKPLSSSTQPCPHLITPDRAKHILDGDDTGGGHRAGTGKPGKSEFPADWSDDKILTEISDVATDPKSKRVPSWGGREIVTGTRDGIDIKVIVKDGNRIITGYPTNVPQNPG